MNFHSSQFEDADAVFVVIGREFLRMGSSAALIPSILHERQRPYFELWAGGVIPLPILVFGHVCQRNAAGARTRTELPMFYCRDAATVAMIF